MTRPNFIEAEAIQRAVQWSEVTGGQLYIVHMSTGEGADIIRAAQARGVPVIAETCVQYLVLDDSVFDREDGHLFACCPQLKKPADVERLWKGLRSGEVSRDLDRHLHLHARAEGDVERGLDEDPNGHARPGDAAAADLHPRRARGTTLPRGDVREAEHQSGAHHGTVSAQGRDPDRRRRGHRHHSSAAYGETVDPARMETNADWSPFEGWQLAGFARTTLSRGDVIVDDYKVVGTEGRGQWLPRTSAGLAGIGSEPPAMRMSRGPLSPLRAEELEIAGAS